MSSILEKAINTFSYVVFLLLMLHRKPSFRACKDF